MSQWVGYYPRKSMGLHWAAQFAPPWRFWAPVPRFPHQTCVQIGYSELLASGS
jgi:hypothetical protein